MADSFKKNEQTHQFINFVNFESCAVNGIQEIKSWARNLKKYKISSSLTEVTGMKKKPGVKVSLVVGRAAKPKQTQNIFIFLRVAPDDRHYRNCH